VTTVLIAILAVLAVGLLAFQVYTLVWELRLPGGVPKAVIAIKVLNIVLLVFGMAVVVFVLVRR
jgi:hypothetical protein